MNEKMTRRAALGTVGAAGFAALAAAVLAPSKASAAERHPKIRAALADLREAREELANADTDFGGHKKAAIEAVNGAIEQLRICLDNG
ncbi:MAG TPA: hypothetical protein VMS17_03285 [Gemmataceae bacterium]|nr:hypothetical protein [Gemmataceae bacterium]